MKRALVILAGCFNPTPPPGLLCGPNGYCPPPLVCKHIADGDRCYKPEEEPVDALPPVNIAFVTSAQLVLNAFNNIFALDAACQSARPGATYVAWYSTIDYNAVDRLGTARGWIRPDGEPFVNTPADLVAGRIFNPLRLDEGGRVVTTTMIAGTATLANGQLDPASTDCLANLTGPVRIGHIDGTTTQWTQAEGLSTCEGLVRLYCFQIDHDQVPAPPAHTGRRAFVSMATTLGNVGRPALDAICQNEASAAGYPGSFIAFVANKGSVPINQLASGGQPWVRPDGVVFMTGDRQQVAPLNVTASGVYLDDLVWGGAAAVDQSAAVDGSDNCDNWTNGALNGRVGRTSRASAEGFGGVGAFNCANASNAFRLYCVEP